MWEAQNHIWLIRPFIHCLHITYTCFLIPPELFISKGIKHGIHWNQLKSISISQCSHFKIAWAVSRACVNSESCSSSDLCCGQRFEEGKERRQKGNEERGRSWGKCIQQHHAVIANTPHHQFTPDHCHHPFSPMEKKKWNLEGRKWLNEWTVGKDFFSLIMSVTVCQTP